MSFSDFGQSLTTVNFKATMCMGRCGGNALCKAKDGPEKRTVSNLGVSSRLKATFFQVRYVQGPTHDEPTVWDIYIQF